MPIQKVCICGKNFFTYPSKLKDNRGKFCSKKCHYSNVTRPSGLIYKIKVVNKSWFKKGNRWEKSINFKDGLWSYHREARRRGMGKKCEVCGKVDDRPRYMIIHHKDGNRRNNNFNNLMTACAKCHHSKLHKHKFYGNQSTKR